MTGAGTWDRDVDELPIVLTGGVADGHWYHRGDFEAQQLAARRMAEIHHRGRFDPASWPLLYTPTTTVTTHRDGRQAVQWAWTGPAQARSLRDLARLDAEATAGKAVV
jgi:hypothetical protein